MRFQVINLNLSFISVHLFETAQGAAALHMRTWLCIAHVNMDEPFKWTFVLLVCLFVREELKMKFFFPSCLQRSLENRKDNSQNILNHFNLNRNKRLQMLCLASMRTAREEVSGANVSISHFYFLFFIIFFDAQSSPK